MKKLLAILAALILSGCGDLGSSEVELDNNSQQVQNEAEQECKDLPDIAAGEILTICEGIVTSVEILPSDEEESSEEESGT